MDVKGRIAEESRKLFFKYGVKRVTMDDVAKALSMSKKTLYQYFSDKDELVDIVTKVHLEEEKKEMDEISKCSINSIEELFLVSKCIRKNTNEINPTVLFDLKRFYPESYLNWTKFKDRYISKSIVNNLKRGIEDGYFRKEINLEIMARLRLMEIQLLFDNEVFPRNQFDFGDVQLQMFNHFVFGIVTEKGRQLYSDYLEKENKEAYV